MQFFLPVLTLAGAAFAGVITRDGPSNVPSGEPAEGSVQAITHLYVCADNNFSGRCENLESNTNQCYNLFNGWNDAISSLGPDAGTSCTIWENYDCSGASISGIVSPGIFALSDWNFNDKASSYKCF
ncbi:hypothetical protein LX36DRAFT_681770 [Colletotrichum falcatum]|nr:hypothetical protein LX36DRAFT_681770 [Colletotrichum falcatum]